MRYTVFTWLLVFLFAGTAAEARLYRWVDNNGQVHYGDKIPPEYVRGEHAQIDNHGVTVQKIDAAKTPEELEKDRELARLRAEKQKLIEQQNAADRVLLRSFRSEDDILMARDGKVASIDVTVQVIQGDIRRLKRKLAQMHENAGRLERAGEKVTPQYLEEIELTQRALNNDYDNILTKEKSKEDIRDAFAQDLRRFRELKNLKADQGIGLKTDDAPKPLLTDNLYFCGDADPDCAKAWARAETFVRNNATTPLQMLGDFIIMTAPAVTDHDINITVARLVDGKGQPPRLFIDLQCKESPIGKEYCGSAKVRDIVNSFQPFMASAVTESASGNTAPTANEQGVPK